MTTHYVVQVETDRTMPDADELDQLLDGLVEFHPSVRESNERKLIITITLPADDLRQAIAAALAVVGQVGDPIIVLAQPENVRDARLGWDPAPEYRTVTEAAEELGVSRQAVLNRILSGTLRAEKVGREWRIPADAVTAGVTGRPRKA